MKILTIGDIVCSVPSEPANAIAGVTGPAIVAIEQDGSPARVWGIEDPSVAVWALAPSNPRGAAQKALDAIDTATGMSRTQREVALLQLGPLATGTYLLAQETKAIALRAQLAAL